MMAIGLPAFVVGWLTSNILGGFALANAFDRLGECMAVLGLLLVVFGVSAWLLGY